ncbi:kinase-like domain-containing protein [Alternaria rosae]|uniref:kinase-like domain-containing protein n=1 Tax=Alternaria rosae TaxID=1187941 RepID=UPI001E8D0ABD|nr:kinase-like domain-containing protein [Alternaria rosae]KAH6870496.1 kinase-like domain-containing protein [Alternaria rosae]
MVPSAAIVRATRTGIRNQLANNIQNHKSFNNDYVRYQDIQKAWSGNDTLQRVFHASLTPVQVKLITEDLLQFLSILVFIRADDFLDGFPGSFFDEAERLLYKDSRLPFRDNQVPPFEDLVLCRDFFNSQFLFTPQPLFESPTVQTIDDQRRLPFEVISEGVFGGAYGRVDKKGISPFYFNTLDNNQNHQVKFVACKTFYPSNLSGQEAKRELDNLQVLKTSRTSHGHIRTHVVILFYRGQHHILLPWADHFDLDFFLREGYPYSGEPLYDFKLRFPKIHSATILQDTCRQMFYISEALEWLHKGIPGHLQRRVHFAHMDLKPNNILIDRDEGSTVGKWILTDFGISTFKEDDEAASADLVSLGNLTFRTSPARLPGAYQPPETEKTDQRSAGRRGDIWAFGCIFAEVLSFALGRKAAVEEFRVSRKQIQNMDDAPEGQNRYRNDFFYEEYKENVQMNGRLGARIRQSYRLRSGVDQWLRKLPTRYANTNRTIDCCVQTIRDILEVDGSKRLGAERLVKKMEHVVQHVGNARKPDSLLKCPLEWSKLQSPFDVPLLDLPDVSQPKETKPLPSIKLTASGIDFPARPLHFNRKTGFHRRLFFLLDKKFVQTMFMARIIRLLVAVT